MVIVATVTLLWGAVIGCAKDDIKKALAGSTMSQIGYMMLGAGLGVAGYAFAIFHLLTHGFFKANMFLGAGSVMHGMNDDVDMRHYGALRKMMPVTFLTFAMGYLAIIGFPGFSGFWSKDKIIEVALTENWLVGVCALLGAGVTGFYMTRLMLMTFFTEKRWEKDVHPHESPKVMTIPLIVLAALSVLGGAAAGRRLDRGVAGPGRRRGGARTSRRSRRSRSPASPCWSSRSVSPSRSCSCGKRDVPREAPQDVSFAHPGRPRRPLRRRDQRRARRRAVAPAHHRPGHLRPHRRRRTLHRRRAPRSPAIGVLLRRVQNGFVRSYAVSILGGVLLVVLALLAVNLA